MIVDMAGQRLVEAGLWAAWALFAGVAAAQSPSPQSTQPDYVGNEVCKTCHDDIWSNFYKNPHFKSVASGKEPPARTGCEGCHGPGGNHVSAGGGSDTIPRAFSRMTPAQALDTCLACHARDFSKANIRRSQHTLSGIACNTCHSIHRPATPKYLLARPQTDLCYSCHAVVRAQFEMPSKHRVNEGFMKCTDCHNPHGTFAPDWRMGQRPRMVKQVLDNEQPCIKCHMDKRGPFVYEHPPVRVEGCDTCHYPHGANNTRLLRRPVVMTLCLECHTGADSFGTRNNGITIQSPTHNLLDPKYQKCTLCHVRIHGSNSDAFFMR
jgi:DmsE family decaheme c-type cytochrome